MVSRWWSNKWNHRTYIPEVMIDDPIVDKNVPLAIEHGEWSACPPVLKGEDEKKGGKRGILRIYKQPHKGTEQATDGTLCACVWDVYVVNASRCTCMCVLSVCMHRCVQMCVLCAFKCTNSQHRKNSLSAKHFYQLLNNAPPHPLLAITATHTTS